MLYYYFMILYTLFSNECIWNIVKIRHIYNSLLEKQLITYDFKKSTKIRYIETL